VICVGYDSCLDDLENMSLDELLLVRNDLNYLIHKRSRKVVK